MDLELVGKRAIVTGGSKGIGLAIAKALSAEGAHVALVARGAEALAAAKEAVEIAGGVAGGRVITVSCDTGDDHAVGHMAADVAAAFGGVDILVNAAAQQFGVPPSVAAQNPLVQAQVAAAEQAAHQYAQAEIQQAGLGPNGYFLLPVLLDTVAAILEQQPVPQVVTRCSRVAFGSW